MRNIAIIPARSGSKRLPDKNIRLLGGKPLLAYSIEAAKDSGMFEEIFVSTDSNAYADIAREWGGSVPFLRSAACSTDTAASWDTVGEVLDRLEEQGKVFDTVTLLQPTSPLRLGTDISAAYRLFEQKDANAVVSVAAADHPLSLYTTLPDDLSLESFGKSRPIDHENKQFYRINGAIYIVKVPYLAKTKNIYESRCFAYIMDRDRSVDIDTGLDFDIAEAILNNLTRENERT